MKILCLSNGHGEDLIAVSVIKALKNQDNNLKIEAYPLVGAGELYKKNAIPLIGESKPLPSHGFLDFKKFLADIKHGLFDLVLKQIKTIKNWPKQNPENTFVLAVGDIVPLFMAWLTGLNYAFVGCAKSDYYIRNENGPLKRCHKKDNLEAFFNPSCYSFWELKLMQSPRCKAVFVRDNFTGSILKKWPIPVQNAGNPMMDDLTPTHQLKFPEHDLCIVLLPGSRFPESAHNWQQILACLPAVLQKFNKQKILFLAAIPSFEKETIFTDSLTTNNWQKNNDTFCFQNGTLMASSTYFKEYLAQAKFGIAMAGTATEQLVGLGKPAIIFPGQGPQFTYHFAEAQSRLLGPSIKFLENASTLPDVCAEIINDKGYKQVCQKNGIKRMGLPGAAQQIAKKILQIMQSIKG